MRVNDLLMQALPFTMMSFWAFHLILLRYLSIVKGPSRHPATWSGDSQFDIRPERNCNTHCLYERCLRKHVIRIKVLIPRDADSADNRTRRPVLSQYPLPADNTDCLRTIYADDVVFRAINAILCEKVLRVISIRADVDHHYL